MRGRCIQPRTHSHCSPVMLPRLSGMVPLSWLYSRTLRAVARGVTTQRRAGTHFPAAHAQVRQPDQAAQAGRDGAVELVEGEVAA